jgi:hypothetical protein
MSIKIILIFLITIIQYIKNELSDKSTNKQLRFLYDTIQNSFNYQLKEENEKTQFDYLFDSIRYVYPLKIFSLTNETFDNGFKVRCFWVDTKTFRVFDLSQLKSKK